MINIPIEIIAIVFIGMAFLVGLIIQWLTKWLLKMKYNPQNDKSKIGEERRRAGQVEIRGASIEVSRSPPERELLQAVASEPPGQDRGADREPGQRRRKLVLRRRK